MFEILFLAGLIIAIGFAARWIFEKTRIPQAIILILIGIALGPLGFITYFGIPNVADGYFLEIAPIIGAIAIISMVFEAGLRLRVKEFNGNILISTLTAVAHIATCTALLTIILNILLGWRLADSLIFGSILGGLSSFASYSILPLVRTTTNLRSSLHLEGTLSTIIVSTIAIALMRYSNIPAQQGLTGLAGVIFPLFSVSFIMGIVLGVLLLFLLLKFKLKSLRFSLLFASLLIVYFLDFSYFGGIGVISIAIMGFVIANSESFFRLLRKHASFEATDSFLGLHGEISLFINTFFFVYLGFIFHLENLTLNILGVAIALVTGIFAARVAVISLVRKLAPSQNHENLLSAVMVPRDLLSATLATFILLYRPGQIGTGIEIVCLVIALSTFAASIGINLYERVFRDTFLFRKEITIKDGRKVVVRSFTKDDFGKLRKFFNKLVEEGAYIAIDQRVSAQEEREIDVETVEKMNSKEMIVWVAEYENNIIARAVAEKMQRRERDNVSLSFYIAKEFRGAGLGTVLMRMLTKESLKTFTPKNLYLTVYSENRKAIKLYEREGFVKVGVLPAWMKYNNTYLDRVYMLYDPRRRSKAKTKG